MSNTTTGLARLAAVTLSAVALATGALPAFAQGTPEADSMTDPCLAAADATPSMGMGGMDDDMQRMEAGSGMAGMDTGTPMAGMDHSMMELDQMYIDMMIPHHVGIIAMAEAALTRLQDERLRDIAQAVVATQQPEIDELRAVRERLYGDPEPMPMDAGMMAAMDDMMPGMSGMMDDMAFQMDAAAQVNAICAAEDADLAFIDLTIPHHRMAIEASEAVLAQQGDAEVRGIALRVIEAQEREIQVLSDIRQERYGSATPEPVGS